MLEKDINACVTVNNFCGISSNNGEGLEEFEGNNIITDLEFVRIEIHCRSALLCELLNNKSQFVGHL